MESNAKLEPELRAAFLTLEGYLDAETVDQLQEQVLELIKGDVAHLVLDLAQVSFISSSGVGVFIGVTRTLRQRGGGVIFINPSPPVLNVFELLGIANVFRTVPDAAAARALLAAAN